jgi:hypothetical protein
VQRHWKVELLVHREQRRPRLVEGRVDGHRIGAHLHHRPDRDGARYCSLGCLVAARGNHLGVQAREHGQDETNDGKSAANRLL